MQAKILGKVAIVTAEYQKYKNYPSKSAIADAIYAKHQLVFKDKEEVRWYLRYIQGAAGGKHRNQKKFNNTMIPATVAKKTKPYVLASQWDNILVISDIHFPNHDPEVLACALGMAKERKVNCIIILGDLLDNTPFSSYDHPPAADDARSWFNMADMFLFDLRVQFPDAEIIWAEGNHDNWYERWMIKKAPVVWGDEYYRMTERLRLDEKGVIFLNQKVKIYVDGLILLHGHTLIKGFIAPVNAARGLFLRAKTSTMIGHVHQTHSHAEKTLKGKLISCFSLGSCCTEEPDYDPHNTKHNQGFAFIKRSKGNFNVENLKYYNGQVYQ